MFERMRIKMWEQNWEHFYFSLHSVITGTKIQTNFKLTLFLHAILIFCSNFIVYKLWNYHNDDAWICKKILVPANNFITRHECDKYDITIFTITLILIPFQTICLMLLPRRMKNVKSLFYIVASKFKNNRDCKNRIELIGSSNANFDLINFDLFI